MTEYTKYPRTLHLPWSKGITDDDKVMTDTSFLEGREVWVSEKMDGECTTMYPDYMHARSIDGRYHHSRSWVKRFHHEIAYKIPEGYRICGENMYAVHSIPYMELQSYFLGFSMWDGDYCLSLKHTFEWFNHIGIKPVPTLCITTFSQKLIDSLYSDFDPKTTEGYVIRPTSGFHVSFFHELVGKFVRENHVDDSDTHWMHRELQTNRLSD